MSLFVFRSVLCIFLHAFSTACVPSAIRLHVLQSRGYIRLLPERRVPHLLPARGIYLFRRAVQTFYIFPTPVHSLFQSQARTVMQRSVQGSNQYAVV